MAFSGYGRDARTGPGRPTRRRGLLPGLPRCCGRKRASPASTARSSSVAPTGTPVGATAISAVRLLALVDLLGQLRGDLVQVTDDREVGDLQDRSLGFLVDRDDRLGGLHTSPVLDRAGDAQSDVQVGRDGLTGLADLEGVRVPPGVNRGPGGTYGGAERVREVLHHGEVLTHTAAAGDHDRGLGELGAGTLLLLDPVGDPGGL